MRHETRPVTVRTRWLMIGEGADIIDIAIRCSHGRNAPGYGVPAPKYRHVNPSLDTPGKDRSRRPAMLAQLWTTSPSDQSGRACKCDGVLNGPHPLTSDSPELAQFIQGGFHALERGRIGLRAAAPAQRLSDLIERNFSAHRPFQDVRSDFARGLRRFAVTLPVKQLLFRLRRARISAEVDGKNAVEIE